MKLGIFLLVIAVLVTIAFFQPYVTGNLDVNVGGGLAMWFVAVPCLVIGIKRIRRHRHDARS